MNHSDAPEVVLYDDPEVIPTEKKPGNLVAPQVPKRRALVGDIRAPTFWIIVAIVAIIVIAAAVGGAVGGTNAIRKKYAGSSISRHAITHLTASYRHLETIRSISATTSSTSGTQTTTSVVWDPSTTSTQPSAATSTAITQIDCPNSNGTVYTSYLFGNINPEPPSSTGFKFLQLCSTDIVTTNLVFTSTATFNDCMELCASMNYVYGKPLCMSVTYTYGSSNPVCWLHNNDSYSPSHGDGYASAILAS